MTHPAQWRLYLISAQPCAETGYAQMAESVCRGGGDVFQLRDKGLADKEFLRHAQIVRTICQGYGTAFIVNDRVEIAAWCGADGVHLGQSDMRVAEARRVLGSEKIIGCSAATIEQARVAEAEGADYIGIGPIFATPLKPDTTPAGLELIRQATRELRVPCVVLGGITLDNLDLVLGAGARCVAVVRAACGTDDIERNTLYLKKHVTEFAREHTDSRGGVLL